RMNLERSPVINDAILLWRHGNDAHLRMLAEQLVTNGWPAAGVVERDDHEIWQRPLHTLGNLGLICHLTDNFYVWLVSKSCEDNFAHEPGMVRHEDSNRFFHGTLRRGRKSPSFSKLKEASKRTHKVGLVHSRDRYYRWLGRYQD